VPFTPALSHTLLLSIQAKRKYAHFFDRQPTAKEVESRLAQARLENRIGKADTAFAV